MPKKGRFLSFADWVVADSLAPNYFASTLETISSDDQLGLIDPRIHLTAVKPNEKDGPDLHNIFVKVRPCIPRLPHSYHVHDCYQATLCLGVLALPARQ